MKSIRITLIATALIAGLTGLAVAQNTMAHTEKSHAGHMEKKNGHSTERHTRHLAELKVKLNLQASQDAAWNTFAQSMHHPVDMAHSEHANFEEMTTPERLDHMQSMKAVRDAGMQQHAEATKSFYASLSADQKRTFDEETARMMKRSGMHSMNHKGGHGHH